MVARKSRRDGARPRPRAADIRESVRRAIVDHRLPPGTRLTEESLCEAFGAGRALVRSALQALAHEHVVTIARNRGAEVAAPSVEEARDVFEARKLIESSLARRIAGAARSADIADLRAALDAEHAHDSAHDRGAAILASGGFHLRLAALAGSPSIEAFLAGLISRTSLVIALYGRGDASACGHADHEGLVAAIAAGEGESAARLMAEHLDNVFRDLDLVRRPEAPVDVARALARRPRLARMS